MWKNDSEVLPILYAIIFHGLSVIDLCIKKRDIKQTFALDLVNSCGCQHSVNKVKKINKKICQFLVCFNLGHT